MKKYFAIAILPILLSACNVAHIDTAIAGVSALSLTDTQVREMTNQSCAQADAQHNIAPANSKYAKRLAALAKDLPRDIDGATASYKVYLTPDINAWAMANGCIRVYSGLMDIMTDDEVRGILGHEIGHVALGHTRKAIQTASLSALGTQVAASLAGGQIAKIGMNPNQIAKFTDQLVNAQFSQKQEIEADDYAFNWLMSKQHNPEALVTAFRKLAELDRSGRKDVLTNIMSSHPEPAKRADRIEQKIAAR